MLRFIGIGISYKCMSMHALRILGNCDVVYLDTFTGFVSDEDVKELNALAKSHGLKVNVRAAKRWFIEDGREILEQAQKIDIAILSYGDPFIATTLIELYVRAVKKSIAVEIIHGASGITSLIGEVGLHIYKFAEQESYTHFNRI
jgi:diphthine synthase